MNCCAAGQASGQGIDVGERCFRVNKTNCAEAILGLLATQLDSTVAQLGDRAQKWAVKHFLVQRTHL